MHSFFDLQRFVRLFIKHTAEHYRTYLMSVAVLAGVISLGGSFIFFIIPEPPDTGMQTACFVILLLISGTLFTSTVFSDYGNKTKAIPAIMLPASSFEKFLVGWLYSYPIFIVVYTAAFFFLLFILGHLGHWPGGHFETMTLAQPELFIIAVIYTMLHALSIFGAILFNKLHFIKTGFAFFVAYAMLLIGNTLFVKVLTGVEVMKAAMPYGFLNFEENHSFYSITINDNSLLILVTLLIAAAIIWVAAYFKLKEKQV